METHKKNIELFLASGGDPKLAKRYENPNLENRAKISYLISKLNINNQESVISITTDIVEVEKKAPDPEPEKPQFLGLISQYPIELHSSYNEAYSSWLNICSLKIQLNSVPDENVNLAYDIQTKMISDINRFDRCKKALDYYQEHKRILPTKTTKDFSKLTTPELYKEKDNIASLISRRKQTIQKMESNLPENSDPTYNKKLMAINLKKEKLEEYLLSEEKIKELLI